MRPTYFTIYLYFINATDLLLLYNLLMDLPLLYQRDGLTLRFTSNFINATELLDSSPIYFYQCDRLTLPYLPMTYLYFINMTY